MQKLNDPLSQITGFDRLAKYFEHNKYKPWQEWLEFDCLFRKSGKQGRVGLLKPKQLIKKEDKNLKYIFKVSKYIDYLVQHEYTIMNGLLELSHFCPHFCKNFGIISCEIDPKNKNPFNITARHPIEKEVLLTEYIDKSHKFFNYIKNKKINSNIIFSIIRQILMAIMVAQFKKNFTHYDLHSQNIMIKKCSKDTVFLYILDEENQFCVPTNGHRPIIIDFGFSYSSDLNDGPAFPSMSHTEIGFTSDRYDHLADPKLFLVTVSDELCLFRKNNLSKKFKRIIRNIFGKLKIDWESGWNIGEKKSATDFVIKMLPSDNIRSKLFKEQRFSCIDLIQSLIILPIEEQSYKNIRQSYNTFVNEFLKIEHEIGSSFFNLYVLKGIIDVTREIRVDYLHENSRKHAISYFRKSMTERIRHVADFCNPKKIHYEKMLCSLLCLSKNIEGILFNITKHIERKKERRYNRLPLKSIRQIYGVIDANIPDNYVFNDNTVVFVMDCVNEKCKRLDINMDTVQDINKINPNERGTFLYNLYRIEK